MRSKIGFALTTTLLFSLLLIVPAVSQGGNGVIVEGNPNGTEAIGSLNPLRCDNPYCRRITDFLFPTLFAVNPATGLLTGAVEDNFGIALNVPAPEGDILTVQLRDDLRWSDGTPVTAYDVFYSFLAATDARISPAYAPSLLSVVSAAMPIDEHTIEFVLSESNCTATTRMNFPVIPAHAFDPDFADTVKSFRAAGDLAARYDAWLEWYPQHELELIAGHPFDTSPSATGGRFDLAAVRPTQDIRLVAENGAQAFVYTDIPPGMTELDLFLSGETDILVNPPLERRDDLKATPDIQIAEYPGQVWDFIAFNLADPSRPQPAIGIDGKILDQGHHPLFADVRVRRALQKAIDVKTLIEVSLLGYGTPLAANRIPSTWAYNDDLLPIEYDRFAAEQLLESAGWKDADHDGLRECRGCQYAREGQPFSFDLMVMGDGRREIAAQFVVQQLRNVGVSANLRVMDTASVLSEAQGQRFDAYMGGRIQRFPADPDQTGLFTRAGDVVNTGGNAGSYYKPQLEELMYQALTLSGCSSDERAAIYRDIQAVLQQDQPYIWLYAQNDMVVARGGVLGFNPLPYQPFWNIRDWIVVQ